MLKLSNTSCALAIYSLQNYDDPKKMEESFEEVTTMWAGLGTAAKPQGATTVLAWSSPDEITLAEKLEAMGFTVIATFPRRSKVYSEGLDKLWMRVYHDRGKVLKPEDTIKYFSRGQK